MNIEHNLAQVVWQWLRTTRERQSRVDEAELDRAVRDTFPASDPTAAQTGTHTRNSEKTVVNCWVSAGTLTMRMHDNDADRVEERPPAYAIEGETPDGEPLIVRVWVDSVSAEHIPAPKRSSETDVVDRPGTDDAGAHSRASART